MPLRLCCVADHTITIRMKCTLLVLCLLPLAINAMYIRARYAGGLRGTSSMYYVINLLRHRGIRFQHAILS